MKLIFTGDWRDEDKNLVKWFFAKLHLVTARWRIHASEKFGLFMANPICQGENCLCSPALLRLLVAVRDVEGSGSWPRLVEEFGVTGIREEYRY